MQGLKIWVSGIVQGVGFRPFIYSLAAQNHLTGWVRNTSGGVEIVVNGAPELVTAFATDIRAKAPPLSRIDHFETAAIEPDSFTDFRILESAADPDQFIPISPDVAICPDCQRELFDPSNRRFRYPFINCTNCGPRFSIIQDIPYDRPKTTMAAFKMCPDCQSEYDNPLDRRFHAQPTACPECGPQLSFITDGKIIAEKEAALQMARKWLSSGKIIAIKGLGGFHLACDAFNPQAVAELRRRKKRSDKAFALMSFDLDQVRQHALLSPAEEKLITSRQKPIVLLQRRPDSTVATEVAPGQKTLGFMLPYTPLHLLLLEPEQGFPSTLVMTSGNISEEPIAYRDENSQRLLAPLADSFLTHDRPIHMRVDDSVVREYHQQIYFSRRSRGYAPDAIQLVKSGLNILATGAELKNVFCLTRDHYAFVSHFIGDLENYETLESYEQAIDHYQRLFRITPQAIACDLHPDYLATRYASQRAKVENLPLIRVQHHHAHLAACLAENQWPDDEPVIGLSFDGTGFGTDQAVWGGEFLFGAYSSFERLFHLAYVPLPGGDSAAHSPAKMALAHLWQAGIAWEPDIPPYQALTEIARTTLQVQIERHINTPLTSSMGRFFDAASALIGIRQVNSYEGQAAIELETIADGEDNECYPFDLKNQEIDQTPFWHALLADFHAGIPVPVLSTRVHNSIARMALETCQVISNQTGCKTTALSGGVWQNKFLLEKTESLLTQAGFNVLIHHHLPPNDGCISLGQAAVATFSMARL